MVYEQPSFGSLKASVARDLHDLDNNVFSSVEVGDLINMGISDINRLVPKEYRTTIPLVDGQYGYPIDPLVNLLFSVEMWRNNENDVLVFWRNLPRQTDDSNSGWHVFANMLFIPSTWKWDTDQNDTLNILGYIDRDSPTDDEEIVDLDLDGETLVRAYCAFTAFQRLLASRSLFQQWQTSANNADVSATQLIGMASTYSREWRDLRMRARRLRRVT